MKNFIVPFCLLISLLSGSANVFAQEQLIKYPDQWQFEKKAVGIILTSDQQLIDLQNPDKEIELTLRTEPRWGSLRMICEQARARGAETLKLAFDNFFRQYRQEGTPERKLTPDDDQFIEYIKNISDFIAAYGLGLELSLLSPLEIGKAYAASTGETGRWVQLITGIRDPETGKFSTTLWEHLAWSNNKGKVRPVRTNIKAFAFKSDFDSRSGYRTVKPDEIKEITSEIYVETYLGTKFPESQSFEAQRMRIYSEGNEELKGYDRVFLIVYYDLPEMDYFSPNALPFLKDLMKKYYDAGIRLNALYSDEMHIQQDWSYHSHHDYGQFTVRYLTENFEKKYLETFEENTYQNDFEKLLLYFVYGPEINSNYVTAAKKNIQYVMGNSPEDVQKTFLLRDRYYQMLNNQVVDLFLSAKKYAESLYGHELLTRAHATWAQSPTIDYWDVRNLHDDRYKYEYTSNFIWSNTLHQAASACYDYFKWGEYLTAMGTDHTEGGWGDRNYYAGALASSFAMVNKYPNSYNGAWGMPDKVRERNISIYSAFGAANSFPAISQITERVHRDVDVLMLYPMDLVSNEERFGSWMNQYGYANYLSSEKVLELGKVNDQGELVINGRSFNTLVALFETFPDPELLNIMEEMAEKGSNIIWSGPPPMIYNTGQSCHERWQNLFGVNYEPEIYQGKIAPGKQINFENSFIHIPDQTVLTDFLVDHIYPVSPRSGTEVVARVNDDIVGVIKKSGKGKCTYIGFRPRDDQAQSLGYETRTWFEILDALGAYPGTGIFPGFNDNTEHLSRTSNYLCTRFPNQTTVIARHYRNHPESWEGGFGRDQKEDMAELQRNPLPSDSVDLDTFRVNGHKITFDGNLLVAFRTDRDGNLLAFNGRNCNEVIIDGKIIVFADKPVSEIAWTPVPHKRQVADKAFFQIYIEGNGRVRIPLITDRRNLKMVTEAVSPGTIDKSIDFKYKNNVIELELNSDNTGRWLYLTGKE